MNRLPVAHSPQQGFSFAAVKRIYATTSPVGGDGDPPSQQSREGQK
jgi:hypothetical protein